MRTYRLSYEESAHTQVSRLTKIDQAAGHAPDALAFPALTFRYSDWSNSNVTLKRLTFEGEIPPSPSAPNAAVVDLDGRGLPGILEGAITGWRFWKNLGGGNFAAPHTLHHAPIGIALGSGSAAMLDLEGNGTADLLQMTVATQGFFPNHASGFFDEFVEYASSPPFDLDDPNVRFVDINGDGVVDAIKSEPDALFLYENHGRDGWSSAPLRIPRIFDTDLFPNIDLGNASVFFADMTGDGLPDIVQLQPFEIVYWPYLGHGRWGHKVTMMNLPLLPSDFEIRRVRFLDVDGDGVTDLVYLDDTHFRIWRNLQGKGWSEELITELSAGLIEDIDIIDIYGEGRPALVLSASDPNGGINNVLYAVDMSAGALPNLLTEVRSDLGHITRIEYGVSTQDLVEDEIDGSGWNTFSPIPVTVCRAIENTDLAAGITQRRSYRYHDGHFCGIEREFCGFNVVEETEESGRESNIGKRTVTRFHVGTDTGLSQRDRLASDLETHRKARAVRGSPLEVEVFETKLGTDDKRLRYSKSTFDTRLEYNTDGRMVVRPFVSRVVEDEFATLGSANRSIWAYSEPNRDGQIEHVHHETGAVSNDGIYAKETSLTEIRQFAKSTSGGQVGPETFLAGRVITDDNGRIMSADRWLYDGNAFVGLPFGKAKRGLVTRHDELVFHDGTDDPGEAPMARGFFWLDLHEFPVGWYRSTERKSHNRIGNPVAIMDALDQQVKFQYDPYGIDLIKVTDAADRETSIEYDHSVEQPRQLKYPSGLVERRDFDRLARATAFYRTNGDGDVQLTHTVNYENAFFGSCGKLISPATVTTRVCVRPDMIAGDIDITDAGSTDDFYMLRRFFSASGIEISAVSSAAPGKDGCARTIRSADRFFDQKGRIVSEGHPKFDQSFGWIVPSRGADRAFVSTFDALGRTTEIVTKHGKREVTIEPRQITIRTPNDVEANGPASIHQDFDGFGRLTSVREAISTGKSSTKAKTYNAKGDLLSILESDGSELASFDYDRTSQRTKINHRDAGTRVFEYDAIGRLSRAMVPTRQSLNYTYDTIGRLIEVKALEQDGRESGSTKFYYDASPDGSFHAPSRLCAVQVNGKVTLFRYDAAGRLTEKTQRNRETDSLTLKYAYDFLGNLSAMTYPNGKVIKYRYGPSGEILAIEGIADSIEYSARGFPKTIQYNNGVSTRLNFHDDDRLQSLAIKSQSTEFFNERLLYDANGNITERIENLENVPSSKSVFTYDLANRLSGNTIYSETSHAALLVEYDPHGNIVRNSEHGQARLSYDPDRLSRLVAVGAGSPRKYDAAGRTIATEALPKLEYDAFDRLRLVEKNDGTVVAFQYDHLGGRTQRITKLGNQMVTVYTMDDLFERGPDGDRMFIRGPLGLVAIIHETENDTRIDYCHSDHLGSVRCQTNAAAELIGSATFTAFGAVNNASTSGLYAGKFGDDDLGLIQMGQRFYEPQTGRFLTPDTYLIERPETAGGMPGLLHPYAYAANNPIRNVDPNGRFPILAAVIIGAVVGAAIGAAAAREQGENPLVGALIGGLVGGLTGGAGLGTPALIGAGMGALTSRGEKVWTGAAVGGLFGAVGGAAGNWLPVIPGNSAASAVGNYFLEIAANGLVAGLSAGTTAAMKGGNFGQAFESGAVTGAMLSNVRIMFFGVRFSPASVHEDLQVGTRQNWVVQSTRDTNGPWSAATNKAGMPDISKVTFRQGGILTSTGRSHAIAPGGISLSKETVAEISAGEFSTLAHELRHITQQNVAKWGYLEFATVWLRSNSDLHYQDASGNGGEAPYSFW